MSEFPEYDVKLAASFVADGISSVDDDFFKILATKELVITLIGLDPTKKHSRKTVTTAIRRKLDERERKVA